MTLRLALLWLGPVLFALGLWLTPALEHVLRNPLRQTILLWLAPLLLAQLLGVLLRQRVAHVLAACWLALLLVFAGPWPLLATTVLALAALALGSRIAPARQAPLQVVLGLVIIAGTLGWLLPLPLHAGWTYWPALLALIAWRRQALVDTLRGAFAGWNSAVAAAPRTAAWAVATLGLLSTAAWLPTLQFDDIAYHLGLPSQLQQLGYYRLDALSQVWALAPWASDTLQGVVQVLAREEARGALNALWLVLLVSGGWRVARAVGEDAVGGFATVALMASLPSLVWLVAGMQVELPAAALALAIATLLADRLAVDVESERTRTWALAILAGGLMGLKASHLLLALPLAAWWLAQTRGRLPWGSVLAAACVALLLGASSYVYAWVLTGNPLLPMFNDWFPNAIAQGSRLDTRWMSGLRWDLPWQMAFDTNTYVEAYPGGAGFLLVLLLGGWLAALVRGPARALAWTGLAAWLLPLLLMQYARYVVPAMLLLVPALVVGTRRLAGSDPRGLRIGIAMLVLAWAANIWFFANGSWIWRAGAVKSLLDFRDEGLPQVWQDFIPERALAATLRERPELRLLVLGPDPDYAEYGGRAFTSSPYDPEISAQVAAATAAGTAEAWAAMFARFGFTHVSLRPGHDPVLDAALPVLGAVREQQIGRVELWRLPDVADRRDLMRERDVARRLRYGTRNP